MPTATSDAPPATVTIPDVPILRPGRFAAATGPVTVTEQHIADALEAFADPQIDSAPLKFGHTGKFADLGDSAPGLGWVDNLRLDDDGAVVADLVDIPAALEAPIKAGFKRRSAELSFGVKTTTGKRYSMVIDGLALLGMQAPAIKDLGDLGKLYRPAQLASEGLEADSHAALAFYDTPPEPDRADRIRSCVEDAKRGVAWLAALVGIDGLAAAYTAIEAMVPADSRGLLSATPDDGPHDEAPPGGKPMTAKSKYLPSTIKAARAFLSDLPADAPDEDVEKALEEQQVEPDADTEPAGGEGGGSGNDDEGAGDGGDQPPADLAAAAKAAGMVLVPATALEQIQQGAQAGAEARALLAAQARDRVLDEAYRAGKLGVGEAATKVRAQLSAQLDKDPAGTKALIDLMQPIVPVGELGTADTGEHADLSAAAESAIDKGLADLFGDELAKEA